MENEKKKKCVIAIRLSWFDVQVAIRILLVASDRKPNPADLNKKRDLPVQTNEKSRRADLKHDLMQEV